MKHLKQINEDISQQPSPLFKRQNLVNKREKIIDDIYLLVEHACSTFEDKAKKDEAHQMIVDEWREMAKRLDSFLLWVFGITSVIMSVVLFIKVVFSEPTINEGICECDFRK